MSLKFRGSSQFKPGSIPLSRLESQTSKSIIGYDSNGNVSALTSGEARTNMEISTSDNVQFANITGSTITGQSLSSSGLITSTLDSGTGLSITADSDLNGALDVQGASNLQSTLTVSGLSQLNGGLNSDGDLSVGDSNNETGSLATLYSKTLTASDEESSDVYTAQGISMSDDGNILAVVSRDWDRSGGGSNHGGIYIYDWDSTNEEWDQRGDVFSPPSDATSGVYWGHSVSLSSDGSYMAVGSMLYTGTATQQGGVYVYKWNSSTNSWDSHGSVVVASDAGYGDRHIMPSLSGDASVLAVGAFSWDSSGKTNDGKIYIYDWSSSIEDWIPRPHGVVDETTYSETDFTNDHSSTYGTYAAVLEYLGDGVVLSGTSGGSNSRIYRSTDNGVNWTSVLSLSSINYVSTIKHIGSGIVLATTGGHTGDGDVYRSTDYGQTWSNVSNISSHDNTMNIEYLGDGICIFGSGYNPGDGFVYRSTDYGATWAKTDTSNSIWGSGSGASGSARTARFEYLGGGICLGVRMTNHSPGQFRVVRSTDYGATWSDINQTDLISDTAYHPAIEYMGDGKVLLLHVNASSSSVYVSTDYGQTFSTDSVFTVSTTLREIKHVGNNRVLISSNTTTSDGGKIYESTDGGDNWNSTAIFDPGMKSILSIAVDYDDNKILVGGHSNAGNATIYILGGDSSVNYLTASDAASYDYFGMGVSLSNDASILAIGASGWEGDTTDQGGVYIYDWNSSLNKFVQRSSGDSIVSNGTFASNANDWTLDDSGAGSSAVWSSEHGGSVKLTGSSGHWGWAIQTVSTTAMVSGKTYKLKIGVHDWTGSVGNADGDNVKNIKYGIFPKSGTNYAAAAAYAVAYPDINDVVSGTSGTIEFEFDANNDMVSDEGFKIGIFYGHLPSPTGYVYIDNVDITDENDMTITDGDSIIESNNPSTGAHFGYDVELNNAGTTLIVGSLGAAATNSPTGEGKAEIFDWNSSTSSWDFRTSVSDPVSNGMNFGGSVAINSDATKFVVGSYGNGSNVAGRAHTYSLSNTSTTNQSKFSVASASGNTNVEGTLDVTGATTLDSTLQAGASTLASLSTSGVINHTGTGADKYLNSGNVNITGGSIIKNVPIGDSSNRSTGHFSSLDTSSDLTVGGNLIVSGSLTTVETSNLIVEDPMILLSKSNTLSNQNFSKIDTLGASDGGSGDGFGYGSAISQDGEVLVVGGSHWDGSGGTDQGAVYVYDKNGDSWTQRGSVLTASDAGANDRYGTATAANGDGSIIAVGAVLWDGSGGTDQGAVYVYEYSNNSWSSKGSIVTPNDAGSFDSHVECSLSSDGTVLAVGALFWDGSGGTNQGAVYVYDWNESTSDWDQRSRITASDAAASDVFGYGVSLSADGTILAIGARDWEGTYDGQGGVYIYDWSDTDSDGTADSWVQRGDVIVSNFEASGIVAFGVTTELNGDGTILAVGQIGSWSSQSNKQVEIFDWNSSTEVWDYRTKIDAEDDSTRTASQSSFGISVTMISSGNKILVGAINDNSGKGYVYSYELGGSANIDIGFIGSFVESSTDKSMGFFRDASDGYFKPFVTEQDLSDTNTIDVSDSSYTKGTIEAEFRGDITFANDVTIGMHADSDLSGSSTWDGNSNLSLDLKIKDDSIQVGNLDFFAHDNTLGGENSSDVKIPSQNSVKAYVDAAVSSGGLTDLESKDILMVDSTGKYVKARKIVEYLDVSSTDESNSYILASTEIETEFKDLSNVYLNGQKLRYSSDSGANNDYWFTETSASASKYSNDLTASDQAGSDQYGRVSISQDGNVMSVGALLWDRSGGGSDHGGVYIYDWNSSTESWDQRGSVLSPTSDATSGVRFGTSTSLSSDGTYLAVGAVLYTDTATGQGGAYVYKWNSSTSSWDKQGSTIVAGDAGANDYHTNVSISSDGTILSVGAAFWDASSGSNHGAVYLYDWDSSINNWIQRPYGILDETTYSETDLVNEHNGNSTYGIYTKSLEYLEDGIVLAGTYTYSTNNSGSSRIYRSTDNGENWTSVLSLSNINTINQIKYLEDGIVLASTAGSSGDGNVYRSTDYGVNWSIVSDVSFHDADENLEYLGNGICIFGSGYNYNDGFVYRSTNYGATWAKTDTSNSFWGSGSGASGSSRAAKFKYLGDGICMGVRMTNGLEFRIIRSTDYGETWDDIDQTTLLSSTNSTFPSVEYLGDGKVLVASSQSTSYVYSSSDYGETFNTTAKFTVSQYILDMEYLGNGRVVVGTFTSGSETNSGKLYESKDYGETWNSTAIFSPGVKRIVSLRLNPENNTLLVGCRDNSDEPTVYIVGDTDSDKKITPTDSAAGDQFGRNVSLSANGEILFVGSPYWEGDNSNQGGVYVYDWSSSLNKWVQRSSGDSIVSNGTFNSNISGWYDYSSGGSLSWNSSYGGSIDLTTTNSTNYASIAQNISYSFVSGKSYKLRVRVHNYTEPDKNLDIRISETVTLGQNPSSWLAFANHDVLGDVIDSEGYVNLSFTADSSISSGAHIRIAHGGTPSGSETLTIDDIQITDENYMIITDGDEVLESNIPSSDGHFGFALEANGDGSVLSVTEYFASGNSNNVQLFDWNSSTSSWDYRNSISDHTTGTGNFGYTLSLSSDATKLAIGDAGNGSTVAGKVFTYSVSSTSTTNQVNFNSNTINEDDRIEISYIIKS